MAVILGFILSGSEFGLENPNISSELSDFSDEFWTAIGADSSQYPMVVGQKTYGDPGGFGSAINGFVLEQYQYDYYYRIHFLPSVLNLGNIISDLVLPLDVWNAYLSQKTLSTLTPFNNDGISVSGPSLPAVFEPLEIKQFEFSVSNIGNPNVRAIYSFGFSDSSDDYAVSIIGIRIVTFPLQMRVPFAETFDWKTDLLISNDGAEQRRSILEDPRQGFICEYPARQDTDRLVSNLIYGWATNKWGIPVWSEAQQIASVTAADTTITCDTDYYDFRDSSLVTIWSSPFNFETLNIDTVGSGVLNLSDPLANSYTNPYIIPTRIGIARGGTFRKNTNGYDAAIQVAFDITDSDSHPAAAASTYLGEDIYYDEMIYKEEDLDIEFFGRQEIIDYGFANAEIYNPWTNNKIVKPYGAICSNIQEVYEFKTFLHRRKGMSRPFWMPTFDEDFVLVSTGILNTVITVSNNFYLEQSIGRIYIAILKSDHTWIPCEITNASPAGTNEVTFVLDTDLSIDASEIIKISYLGFYRLNSDKISMNWPGNGVLVSKFSIVEITP